MSVFLSREMEIHLKFVSTSFDQGVAYVKMTGEYPVLFLCIAANFSHLEALPGKTASREVH